MNKIELVSKKEKKIVSAIIANDNGYANNEKLAALANEKQATKFVKAGLKSSSLYQFQKDETSIIVFSVEDKRSSDGTFHIAYWKTNDLDSYSKYLIKLINHLKSEEKTDLVIEFNANDSESISKFGNNNKIMIFQGNPYYTTSTDASGNDEWSALTVDSLESLLSEEPIGEFKEYVSPSEEQTTTVEETIVVEEPTLVVEETPTETIVVPPTEEETVVVDDAPIEASIEETPTVEETIAVEDTTTEEATYEAPVEETIVVEDTTTEETTTSEAEYSVQEEPVTYTEESETVAETAEEPQEEQKNKTNWAEEFFKLKGVHDSGILSCEERFDRDRVKNAYVKSEEQLTKVSTDSLEALKESSNNVGLEKPAEESEYEKTRRMVLENLKKLGVLNQENKEATAALFQDEKEESIGEKVTSGTDLEKMIEDLKAKVSSKI